MDRDRLRIRLTSAAWMFVATVVCCGLCYIFLRTGMGILFARGITPGGFILAGIVFGVGAPICLLWTIKILIWGTAAEREAPTVALEQPWWQAPQ